MASTPAAPARSVRYEPDERPPAAVTVGLAWQYAAMTVAPIVFTPAIMIRAAGGSEAYTSWAAFAVLLVSGMTTLMQAVRLGRLGAGYILMMGSSATFVAVGVTAIEQGGPGLFATLIVVSSLVQFALAAKLSLLRRIFTPTVTGTVIMLISVTLMPIIFDLLRAVPETASAAAAPVSAVATLGVTAAVVLRAGGVWRLWGPAIGIAAGCACSAAFGLYDARTVAEASWVGWPGVAWPGLDLSFGPAFWALLPAFVLVTIIGAVETVGDGVAIQRASWRTPRAVDFRAVQGAVTADGVGNLLSGLAGTMPNTTYSSSIAVAEITGVAARSVGVGIGVIFVSLAFLPKFMAAILAIPAPVMGASALATMAILFALGMKIVVQGGIDYRKSLVAGVAFWVGSGFQSRSLFADYYSDFWGGLLQNGMTVGGFTAILLTLFLELTGPRRRRLRTVLDADAHPKIRTFLTDLAARRGWSGEMAERLRAVGEETLLTLLERGERRPAVQGRRLLLIARADGAAADLEFIASPGEENLEDRMAMLGSRAGATGVEEEASLRLLRHYASSVRHQQYHDTDVITVRVEPAASV